MFAEPDSLFAGTQHLNVRNAALPDDENSGKDFKSNDSASPDTEDLDAPTVKSDGKPLSKTERNKKKGFRCHEAGRVTREESSAEGQ